MRPFVSRRVVSRIARIAVCALLVLWLVPAAAPALVNDSQRLDVGAGETLTLDGEHRYSVSVVIHDGGVLRVGSSGTLILRAPTIEIRDGGVVTAAGTSGSPNGGTIILECDRFSLDATASALSAAGWNSTNATVAGGNGGSIHVRAAQEATLSGGIVTAAGGAGCSGTYTASSGGVGGQVVVRSRSLVFAGSGTRVSVAGGDGGDVVDGSTAGGGGDAGSVALLGGSYAAACVVDASGGDGGDALHHPQGEGGNGGRGGTVSAAWCAKSGTETYDVSGGLGGSGDLKSGTPGAAGSATSTLAIDAQFDDSEVADGAINDYSRSWTWQFTGGGVNCVAWLSQDGTALQVAVRNLSDLSRVYDVFVDTAGDGGSAPKADDYWFSIEGSFGALFEKQGTGSGWADATPTGWSAAMSRRYVGSWVRDTEFEIPFSKLGITAGQAKTMRLAIAVRLSSSDPVPWPSGASHLAPSTWPVLSSVDLWTIFRNVAPGTPPGGWDASSIETTIFTAAAPNVPIAVRDYIGGVLATGAQYRYSTNGGASWSSWTTATCSGATGSEATVTLTAVAAPLPDSMTQNKIQFRVADTGGMTGTSAQIAVRKDATPPGGWSSFSPATTVRNTLTPDCTVRVQDVCSGLEVASAQYRYSTNGGASWSDWAAASCTGARGTTAQQTILADDVPFQQNSSTANRVQFRIADVAGNLSASPVYTVVTDAPLTGLPLNGSFEIGLPSQVPSLWQASARPYLDGYQATSKWSWNAHLVGSGFYDGQQAVHGRIVVKPDRAPLLMSGYTNLATLSSGDYTGISQLELWMKDIVAGETDPTNAVAWYDCRIDAVLSDGDSAVVRPLYRNLTGTITDSRIATATGADGATWSRYVVSLSDPSLDPTQLSITIRWEVRAPVDVGFVYDTTAVFCESVVDGVRAIDPVLPVSSCSVSGAFWSYARERSIAWSASDNVGLAALEFWARNDPGTGFGSWTKLGERALGGVPAASGVDQLTLPGEGVWEVYTVARDTDGNSEQPPSSADDSCGIDEHAPSAWTDFQPSGWVTTQTVDCSITTRDPLSGLRAEPVFTASSDRLKAPPSELAFTAHGAVWAACGTALTGIDARDPHAPAIASTTGILDDPLLDLYVCSDGTLIVSGGRSGIAFVDASNVFDPQVIAAVPGVAAVEVEAPDLSQVYGGLRVAFTIDEASEAIASWDITDPTKVSPIGTSDQAPAPLTALASADGVPAIFAAAGDTLVAYDVTDPGSMPIAATVGLKTPIRSLATDGECVYAASEDGALSVFGWDGSSFVPVSWTGSVPDPGALAFADSHLYATASGSAKVFERAPGELPFEEFVLGSDTTATAPCIAAREGVVAIAESDHVDFFVHGEPMWSFSRDGGETWSAWMPASNPLGDTDQTTTLTAPTVPFGQDSDSKNLIRYRAGDAIGLLGYSKEELVPIDTTVGTPIVSSSTHPTAQWRSHNDPAFSWTPPTDLSGVVGYSYVLTANLFEEPDSVSEGSATTTSYVDVPDGTWYFKVRALDAAGNWGAAAIRPISIDTNPPSGSFVLNAGASWTSTTTVACDSAVTDALSGVAQMRFSTDGGATWGDWQPYAASATVTLPSGDGTKTVTAQYRDAAGNVLELSDDIALESFRHVGPPLVDRWWGLDRYRTAVAISANSFRSAQTVVIATGKDFPDALSASALAGACNGPLLLTDPASLPTAVAAEIKRLGATRAFVVGGPSVVTTTVVNQIKAVSGMATVERIYGADRYQTAARVASKVMELEGDAFCDRVFIARGDQFPDALAASPVAFAQRMPILLVKPTLLPDVTRAFIDANDIETCIVLGGTGAVSDGVKNDIGNLGATTDRWEGGDRFATACAVASKATGLGWARWDFIGLAFGRNFPDALAGGAGAGAYRGALLLTETGALPSSVDTLLRSRRASIVGARIFGGTSVVSSYVESQTASALTP
ncbi:MAG: cell wall-binding repeat-containing protein [Anaerosomatales bacterium]|nr:cell wall-binding repeat-containing protein [Anaerosomatales bacterium]